MKESMLSKGWVIVHECKCGGVHRIEFTGISFPGIKIKVFPGKKLWKAVKKGIKLKTGTPDDLENYLNELVA